MAHTIADKRRGTLFKLTPHPDWRNYRSLSFVAASADGGMHLLEVLITDNRPEEDSPKNRYREEIIVTPIPKRFEIELEDIAKSSSDRPFDFEHMSLIELRAKSRASGAEIYLDDFRLEN